MENRDRVNSQNNGPDTNVVKTQVVSGMFWKFGERIIAQGVAFIVTVVLARILMPEDYGAVAVVTVFISLATVFLTSGLNVSLIQKKEADDTDFSTIFWCNLAIGILLYIVLFFAAPLIAVAYKQPILVSVIRVFAVTLPISSFQSIQSAYVSKHMQFKKFFFSTIIGTLISAVVGIAMAYKGYGVWALVAQHITNTVIDTLVLFITVRWRPRLVFSNAAALPLIKYGYKVTMTDFIGTVFNNLVAFTMGIKYSSSNLAYYTKGFQVPRLFRDNIFSTVISVLFPAMSNLSDDVDYVKRLARRAIRLMCYLTFPLMFGVLAVNETFIVVLYTDKWMGMSPYIIIACLEAVISVSPTIGFQAIKSLGRSDILLKNELLTKPVYVICVLTGMIFSPFAMAVGMLLASVYCCIVAVVLIKRIVNYSFKEQFVDAIKPLISSAVMVTIVWLIGRLEYSPLLKLIIQVIIGVVVYFVTSIITHDENYDTLKHLIFEKVRRKHHG